MKQVALFICAAGIALGGAEASVASPAQVLCVGGKPGCYASLQAAVNAAHDGDTITIAPGTYAGGVTIDVSVSVVGAGAAKTIIKGGGPVLTIGEEQGVTEPTVAISGVTITGGINNSLPGQAVAQGGGVRIPQGAFQGPNPGLGATVTISDSVVTGNEVMAEQLLPSGCCGCDPFDCSFASGGGIFDDGTLTLVRTRVTNNQVGDPSSITVVANGGGIEEGFQATLTIENGDVSDNRVVGSPPWGDATGGAGIDARGRLEIADSVISGNDAQLSTDDPTEEFPNATAGGIGIGGQATISRTRITDNSVTAVNVGGQALAVAGGILDEGSLTLIGSSVERNHVNSSIPASSANAALAGAGGIEVDGDATIRDSRFVGNAVVARAPAGLVGGGGGALSNFGQTTLERTLVTGNSVTMNGASGSVHGGGLYNDTLFGSTPSLTVGDSAITANRVVSSTGVTPLGGGLFTAFPVTLTNTVIAGNQPDQCFGC
jgi:hypothetical protein